MIEICEQERLDATIRGNRQHYLRWDSEQTPDHLDAAGYDYDTTGGFADAPGFRYGTGCPFSMWSWRKRSGLEIKQRPLILMESTVLGPNYMDMGYGEESLELMRSMKERAMRFGGCFTLLWHNSHLKTEQDREFFQELIR